MKSSFTYQTKIQISNNQITYLITLASTFNKKGYIAIVYMINSGSSLYNSSITREDELDTFFDAVAYCIMKLNELGNSPIKISYV